MTITFYSINGGRQYQIDAPGDAWHGFVIEANKLGRFLEMAERQEFDNVLVC